MNPRITKNLLDLEFNKYLQIYNASIILLFSFLVGLLVALLTNQIDFSDKIQVGTFFIASIVVIFAIISFMVRSHYKLKLIPKEISKLEI